MYSLIRRFIMLTVLAIPAVTLAYSLASGSGAVVADNTASDGGATTNNYDNDIFYTIDDQGRVDKGTYNGWRRFGVCGRVCHGPDGTGNTCPSLLDSIKQKKIDFATFKKIVAEGQDTALPAVMPGFKNNPNVTEHYKDLYSWIRARSDGKIPGGRPERIR